MNKKVLLLGSDGMLGHDLAEAFADYDLVSSVASDLDITNESAVQQKVSEVKPDIIINAAAYTNVDGAEQEEAKALAINGTAVGYLAAAAKEAGALFIQVSTEYVFDGTNKDGYNEDAALSPANAYGRSKALGEAMVQQRCDNYYIVRTSWLYGKAPQKGKPRGLNFVETMLSLAQKGQELNVVNDQFGKPTFTKDLSAGIKELVESDAKPGIYHLINEGECSWYDFAKKIFEIKGVEANLNPISSKEYPMPTPRPQYSVLHNTKTKQLRNWEEALKEYLL